MMMASTIPTMMNDPPSNLMSVPPDRIFMGTSYPRQELGTLCHQVFSFVLRHPACSTHKRSDSVLSRRAAMAELNVRLLTHTRLNHLLRHPCQAARWVNQILAVATMFSWSPQ